MKLRKPEHVLSRADVERELTHWRRVQRLSTNQDDLNEATAAVNRLLELWGTLQPA